MGIIGEEIDPDRAAANARLAWTIVGASGLLVLILAGVLTVLGIDRAKRTAMEGMERARADSARRPPDIVTIPTAPIPPDTAKPIGNVGSWIGTNDYPIAALRAGEEGRVRVTLAIDAAGSPTGCSVAQSSGSWSLDNGTCLVMMREGRFDRAKPGQVGARTGEVRRWTSPPVRWVLP